MSKPTTGPYWTAPGQRRKFGSLAMWAEDGMVFFEWEDGEADVLDLPTARGRLAQFVGELDVWDRAREGAPDAVARAKAITKYHSLRGYLEQLRDTIKDAEDQGDQTDPGVRKKKLLAFLRGRRAGLVKPETLAPADLVFRLEYESTARRPGVLTPAGLRPLSGRPGRLPAR